MTVRHFLKLSDLSLVEARRVHDVSRILKREPLGKRTDLLRGQSVAILMEKASTRTRVSFEVGVSQLGAQPVVLGIAGSQLGRGEPLKDTARVLGRYCNAIVYRTYAQSNLEQMKVGGVPVINALSDDGHPVQVLCDVFTVEEHRETISGKKVAFVGDCSCNMARSWLEAAVLFNFHLVLVAPKNFLPPEAELRAAEGHVSVVHDPKDALRDVAVVNTDVWASMGQEDEAEERRRAMAGFRVDGDMLKCAKPEAVVLHCLPAHRGEEIDEATLEGPQSVVWDQAENRLHVQKGLMCFLLGVDGRIH